MRAIFLRHVAGFLPGVLTTLGLAYPFMISGPVCAQPPANTPPADVQKAFSNIGDLDLLKALGPLQLTTTQITKLKVPLKEIAEENDARRKAYYEALRSVAAEVAKAREAALSGSAIPQELENKVLKILGAADDRYAKGRQEAINKVFGVAKEALNTVQMDEIERQIGKMLGGKRLVPKEYQNDPKKAPKQAIQDLALQMFVERILIADRTIDLLTAMKPANGEGKAANEETKAAEESAKP